MSKDTLLDKIWNSHTVERLGSGKDLILIDTHFLDKRSSPGALTPINVCRRVMSSPAPGREREVDGSVIVAELRPEQANCPQARALLRAIGVNMDAWRAGHSPVDRAAQGIVRMMVPEGGLVFPGMTAASDDCHTSALGGLGAVGLEIGADDVEQVLETRTLVQRKPKVAEVRIDGDLQSGVTARDVATTICRTLGGGAAVGYALEFTGNTVRSMSVDGRLSLCNVAVELGARTAYVSPDVSTFAYLAETPFGRLLRRQGRLWEDAVGKWKETTRADAACFDRTHLIDVSMLEPQISWGTQPSQAIAVDGMVPEPSDAITHAALAYMGLEPGVRILGLPVDSVFIGSRTNARISDLRAAAALVVASGRRVARNVHAVVVPGSSQVRAQAEREGLDVAFRSAGFHWQYAGCSMYVGSNRASAEPFRRCVATTHFSLDEGHGLHVRTHIASPLTAAASALLGCIADPRSLLRNAAAETS
ncbi:MAG: aconitase family protein [Aquisalimonadaceae bacterium]